MINLYHILGINPEACETEILIALARYLYKNGDNADADIIAAVKRLLLNEETRAMYKRQLLAECPEADEGEHDPAPYLGIFFELDDQAAMLRQLILAVKDLKKTNAVLDKRITQLRSEEKIYKFPVRDRELLDINYQLFSRHFVNEAAKTVYFSMLQILARHKKPVRYLLYTESNGYSYIRYYEYIILKFKLEGRKRYVLTRTDMKKLHEMGIDDAEPSLKDDGALFRSRLLIDNDKPLFLDEKAVDLVIEEVIEMYDAAIESIETFNEAVLRVKQRQVERFLSDKYIKTALEKAKEEEKAQKFLNPK